MLELNHIKKVYNPGLVTEMCIFDDFSLQVKDKEFVSIIGSNGSGKTSLLNIICGSIPVDKGEITVNGQKSNLGLGLYDSVRDGLNWGALTIAQKTDFKKGDTITADVVFLPYGARSGQTNCDSVLNVYKAPVTNPLTLTAATGAKISDTWIPTVQAVGNTAEFTLSGGTSDNGENVNYTVKVTGFTKLGKPLLRENVNGTWQDLPISSELGYDGYSVYYENGKITYSFVISKGA